MIDSPSHLVEKIAAVEDREQMVMIPKLVVGGKTIVKGTPTVRPIVNITA